jgi:multidrug efflux pump
MTQLGVPSSVRGLCRYRAGVPADHELAGDPDLAAIATVYIVLGMLYESYVHPLTISRRCPPPAWALLALELFDAPFSLIALSGSCY